VSGPDSVNEACEQLATVGRKQKVREGERERRKERERERERETHTHRETDNVSDTEPHVVPFAAASHRES
jgi:hypothetical protein